MLVVGGSRGIGRGIALEFARAGVAEIIVTYKAAAQAASEVCEEITCLGATPRAAQLDVTDGDQIRQLFAELTQNDLPIDVVVNNVGIAADRRLNLMSADRWQRVVETNLSGPFLVTRSSLHVMRRRRAGAIVNVGSVVWSRPMVGQANYAAAKAGLVALTRSTALEGAAMGVRCNLVAPGLIDTDMTRGFGEQIDDFAHQIPAGEVGTPEDVARAVRFLASNDARYITGITLVVDGGLTLMW